jgi:hypothetical protein
VPSSGNGGTTLDADTGDLDNDGDSDAILANDGGGQQNRYWENVLGVPDTHAPTIHQLTLQSDKSDGSDTVVRVQLRDNASFYIIAFYAVDLMVSVDGGTENRLRMFSQGGQQFQATIPGELSGQISYRVMGRDDNGNQFASAAVSYQQTSSGTALLQTLDDGTPGLYGNPWLWLSGTFAPGTEVTVGLTDGRPQSLAVLFFSLASTPVPFKGGLLHTVPIVLELPLATDLGGQLFLDVTWPAGVPVGTPIWYQYGIQDDTAFGGASLSNAVISTQP